MHPDYAINLLMIERISLQNYIFYNPDKAEKAKLDIACVEKAIERLVKL